MIEASSIPYTAEVVSRRQESPSIFTLELRLKDSDIAQAYRFVPGQFNMLSLFGVGEIPISIVSAPDRPASLEHTIRQVGRVTHGFAQLDVGDQIGLRGPYGRGWPLEAAQGRDVLVITGGLGCAPVTAVIQEILRHPDAFGQLTILQGVKHSEDHIWRDRYHEWSQHPRTQVLLAADVAGPGWPGVTGPVTQLLDMVHIDPDNSIAMLCGPEAMMAAVTQQLGRRSLPDSSLWLSMERSMHCATGHCGHCQFGARFVCRDGPIFCYSEIRDLLSERGF